MKLIVLTGLVVVEKIDLAVELARHFVALGRSVVVIDNIARLPIASDRLDSATLMQRPGDITPVLLADVESEVVILAVSETANPDELFVVLDTMQEVEIHTLALVDDRTCDCFPQVRELLEMYADTTLHMPVNVDEYTARDAIAELE